MSDAFWTAIIAATSTIIIAWMQNRQNRQLQAIHTLVNSAMGVQLRINADLSRWKADRTGNPEHAKDAEKAEKLYLEHEESQAKVDKTP